MAISYAKDKKGRRIVISGPRAPEYLEESAAKLRKLSDHLEKVRGVQPSGNGNANKN